MKILKNQKLEVRSEKPEVRSEKIKNSLLITCNLFFVKRFYNSGVIDFRNCFLLFTLLLIFTLSFAFSSCGKKEKTSSVKQEQKTNPQQIKRKIKKNENKKEEHLFAYLFNKEGNLKKVVLNFKQQSTTKKLNLKDKLLKVLNCVQNPPKDLKNYSSPFPEKTKIKQIFPKNKICIINLNKNALAYGGGIFQETNFLAALVLTATQFKEIKEVQILVEGKKVKAFPEGTETFNSLKRKDFIAHVEERK